MDFQDVAAAINGYLYHNYVLYMILFAAVLFTVWSVFMQYRAITHGTACVAGRYSDGTGAGALSHFQALSTALSATVGLGNIGGVAFAIAIGGPGAVFWMWVVGFFGMALKSTEVILSMLYRDTSNPNDTRGGPMWVAEKVFAQIGDGEYKRIGVFIGFVFAVSVIVAALLSGNYFQATNVAEVLEEYHGIPQIVTALFLAIIVGVVIVGGVKRIGQVASAIVPFMCIAYLIGGVYILIQNADVLPSIFSMILDSAFNKEEAAGAFLGAGAGLAFAKGMQRALFSSEAGAGSAPIAHSAAKGKEPVREGIVAGLEPFIDTLIVCTITALVILSSGIWNRAGDMQFAEGTVLIKVEDQDKPRTYTLEDTLLEDADESIWVKDKKVYTVIVAEASDARETRLHKLSGKIVDLSEVDTEGNDTVAPQLAIRWDERTVEKAEEGEVQLVPKLRDREIYREYVGAVMTAKAFEQTHWALGQWLVPIAVLMFAFSTMISWSYYGEQGVRYMAGDGPVMTYRILYCAFVLVAGLGYTDSNEALDAVSQMGFGFMFVINVPLTLGFGYLAMRAYKDYIQRLKAGLITPVRK